jgi:hypothetical protein
MNIKIVFLIGSFLALQAQAVEFAAAPTKNYYSTASWKERRVLVIPAGETHLMGAAYISVDEVILQGQLVTDGFPLKIDTIRMTFGPLGKIVAFTQPAGNGPLGGTGPGGKLGAQKGGAGGDALDGDIGGPGQDGHQDPGAIVIHAVETIGTPIVDGTGQKGGQGGKGGPGGKGGQGGKGEDGNTNCWGNEWSAGRGGQGGKGGPGGKGGQGGKAGRPVPVIFVSGDLKQISTAQLTTTAGDKGSPGEPGDPGASGDGGEGGEGHRSSCGGWIFSWTVSVGKGQKGPLGPEQKENLGPGVSGDDALSINSENEDLKLFLDLAPQQPQPVLYSFDDLAEKRKDLITDWQAFHWARNFLLLTYETMAEAQSEKTLPDTDATENELLNQLLNNVDQDRASLLADLWESQFLNPIVKVEGEDPSSFTQNSKAAAEEVVKLLRLLSSNISIDAREQVRQLITSIQSKAESQFQGSLEGAMITCKQYISQLAKVDSRAINLSPYYRVPVCSGNPDFRKTSNISAAIQLFPEWQNTVPDALTSLVTTIAMWSQPQSTDGQFAQWIKASARWILPVAQATGFESVEDEQEPFSTHAMAKSLSQRSWLVEERGRLQGFEAPAKNLTTNQIGKELRYISESLNVMRGKR